MHYNPASNFVEASQVASARPSNWEKQRSSVLSQFPSTRLQIIPPIQIIPHPPHHCPTENCLLANLQQWHCRVYHNLGMVVSICFHGLSAHSSVDVIPSEVTMAPAVWPCCGDDLVVFLDVYLTNGLDIIHCFGAPMHIQECQIALLWTFFFVTQVIQVQRPLKLDDFVSSRPCHHNLCQLYCHYCEYKQTKRRGGSESFIEFQIVLDWDKSHHMSCKCLQDEWGEKQLGHLWKL